MLLVEWNYDPNRLHKSPIQHLLARLKVICFHYEGLENSDKFSCLGLSYTETSCRLLNLHFYQPEVGRRFQNHLQSFLLNASALSTLLCTAVSHAVIWHRCRVSYTSYIFQQPGEAKEETKVTLCKSSWIHESNQKKKKKRKETCLTKKKQL